MQLRSSAFSDGGAAPGSASHFVLFVLIGYLVLGIEPHANRIGMGARAWRKRFGRGARRKSLDDLGCRTASWVLSRMWRSVEAPT
jgi:hypothetical protein